MAHRKMKNDIQQCLTGFKTVAVIGGPLTVHVHKALDTIYAWSDKVGYFLTVDLKFKKSDALNIGKPGWEGLSRAEALREASKLATKIAICFTAMDAANKQMAKCDNITNRITWDRQTARFDQISLQYLYTITPNQ
jgi:hypothetical protein